MKFKISIKSITSVFLASLISVLIFSCKNETGQKPNILWIYVEDICPSFNCYGEELVNTPNVDRLAQNGIRFTNTIMPAPVCSPCRSAIITGTMQTTLGLHNHHSSRTEASAIHLPEYIKTIPELFKEAGYFTFNSGKDDYNFWYNREDLYSGEYREHQLYGKSGKRIDWNSRPADQPFFGQIQLYGNKHIYGENFDKKVIRQINPDSVTLPPYYPDLPFMRNEWADYLEAIEITDREVGEIIQKLDSEGLLENTYIFFFSDHGMRLWRHKQFLYEGGIHVPFIIAFFGKDNNITKGEVNTDLISGLDIGTTSLDLANISIPDYTEGQSLISETYVPREFIISARDRCDFTIDRIRSVRTQNFKYIRNFKTDRPYMQPNYRDEWDITKQMRKLFQEGKLNEVQSRFWEEFRPAEELYDLRNDLDEISNLADDEFYREELEKHREILQNWIHKTDDKGQYPEEEEGLRFMYEIWGEKCINPEYKKVKLNNAK